MKKLITLIILASIVLAGCVTTENNQNRSDHNDNSTIFEMEYRHLIQFNENEGFDAQATKTALDAFFKSHRTVMKISYETPESSVEANNPYYNVNAEDSFTSGDDTGAKAGKLMNDYMSTYKEIFSITVGLSAGGSSTSYLPSLTERGGEISPKGLGLTFRSITGRMDFAVDNKNDLDIIPFDEIIFDEIVLVNDPSISKYAFIYYVPKSATQQKIVKTVLMGHSFVKATYEDTVKNGLSKMNMHASYASRNDYAIILMLNPQLAQYLDRDSMIDGEIDNDFWARPDLGYRDVINGFMDKMENSGYNVHRKVFMTGFSNGGIQSNIFPTLHPEMVEATAPGAAGRFIYPVEEIGGFQLTYPMGFSDIDEIDEITFTPELFKEVEQFIYVGANDKNPINDPLWNLGADTAKYREMFGSRSADRVEPYANFLKEYGVDVEYKIYEGFGHDWDQQMIEDTYDFFNSIVIE
jgi:hypothetical protein